MWGCEFFPWHTAVPIIQTSHKMNGAEYRSIVKNIMLPFAEESMAFRWVYQQIMTESMHSN